MLNQFKTLLLVVSLFFHVSAKAFIGELEYEIEDTLVRPDLPKNRLIVGIKKNLLRIEYKSMIKGYEFRNLAFLDFNTQKGVLIKRDGNSNTIDLKVPFKSNKLASIEELVMMPGKKEILGYEVQEYAAYFTVDAARLPLRAWYSKDSIFGNFRPVWALFLLHPEMSLINYLFHPTTRQIALELYIERINKSKVTYRCIRKESKVLDDKYFRPK